MGTKPWDFITHIACFDMRWMWTNSEIGIFMSHTLYSLLKNHISNSPKKLDMVMQNLEIITILSIWCTIPFRPLHWVVYLTNWSIWDPFSNWSWLNKVERESGWTKSQFEKLTESAVNISFHSLSDGGLNFCSSSKVTS